MDNEKILHMNAVLMEEMRAQGSRHAGEISHLAKEVRDNTKVVQECLVKLAESNGEREAVARFLCEVRKDLADARLERKALTVRIVALEKHDAEDVARVRTGWFVAKTLATCAAATVAAMFAFVKWLGS